MTAGLKEMKKNDAKMMIWDIVNFLGKNSNRAKKLVGLVVDGVLFVVELMLLFMVGVRLAGACMSVSVRRWRI